VSEPEFPHTDMLSLQRGGYCRDNGPLKEKFRIVTILGLMPKRGKGQRPVHER